MQKVLSVVRQYFQKFAGLMKLDWKQQTVVITGAYGGLGQALVQTLSAKGAQLILVGRNASKLTALKNSVDEQVLTLVGDVSNQQTTEKLAAVLTEHQSEQRMLINNAAISHAGFLANQSSEDIIQSMQVNLIAPILLTKQLLPWLKQARQAQVINIGSSFGGIGYPGFSSYCASKFGLRGFTQALSRELSGSSVTASYLAPRAMSTGINSSAVDAMNKQLGHAVDEPVDIAARLIKSIEKQTSEQFYGWPEKLFVKLNALLPSVVSKAIKKDQSTIQTLLNNEVKS